jgi:hypothetical protein
MTAERGNGAGRRGRAARTAVGAAALVIVGGSIFLSAGPARAIWTGVMGKPAPAGRAAARPSGPSRFERAISEEDRQWLDVVIPAARADAFSDDLTEVMASLPERDRKLIVMFQHGERRRYLYARSWALTKEHMTGEPAEVEYILSFLEAPIRVNDVGMEEPDAAGHDEETRNGALWGLEHAAYSGLYPGLKERIERVAVAHARAGYKDHGALLLVILRERGGLSEEGRQALAPLLAREDVLARTNRNLALIEARMK